MDRILALTPVPTIVLSAQSFQITQISQSYLSTFSLTLEECLGIPILDFINRMVPDFNCVPILDSIGTAVLTKAIKSFEIAATTDEKHWTLRIVPIVDDDSLLYVVIETQDTTEEHRKRKALEDQLQADETYRMLVQTVKDYAIFMLDAQGHVMTWNTGAGILKGYTREEIVGRHFSTFYSEDDRIARKPEKELEAAIRDGRVEDEGWRHRKDGTRFWANVMITPVIQSGVVIGFSKVTRDLTERRAAEARLISAYQEADKLKSAFLANMSHEIRTPMHGMLSALTLLLDTGLSPEQKELTDIIEESGSVLLQVINDILDYSKLSSGSFPLSWDTMNVTDIIASVVRGLKTTLKRGVRLETLLRVPTYACGDSLRYRQLVQNLLANAAKFTDTGYISIRTSLISEDKDSYTILTEVIDSGIGVPSHAVNTLFTPFTQFDNSPTKRYKGTGLGLSICKSLTQLMGGTIGFYPNPDGQGSVFWFTVKLGKVADERLVSTASPPLNQAPFDIEKLAAGRRLLLAEDNLINQKVMLKLLNSHGFQRVDVAPDGAEAVSLVKQNPIGYSLILMDINMPILDGVAATKEIRGAGFNMPIVAMTANALKGDAEEYLKNGLDDYISKPVDRRQLLASLQKWLQVN